MNNEDRIKALEDEILVLERESLLNIVQTTDKQMIAKIMKLYEEQKDDN